MRSTKLDALTDRKPFDGFIPRSDRPVGADFRGVPIVVSKTDLQPVSVVSPKTGCDSMTDDAHWMLELVNADNANNNTQTEPNSHQLGPASYK